MNENFESIAPTCFFFEATSKFTADEIARKLRKAYLPFDIIDLRSFTSLNQLFADGVIGLGVHRFVHYVSKFSDVFYYKFTYTGRYSLFVNSHGKPYGVHHADDIQYLFSVKHIGQIIGVTDPENSMVERMTRIWAQFAKAG